jgi:hypothetical protein
VWRTAELRFPHPYAVVAVVDDRGAESQAWQGIPVFSAWVAEIVEAD